MESENLSLRKLLDDGKALENLHPPNDALHVEILDLKNKHEEIRQQQVTFKQETNTH